MSGILPSNIGITKKEPKTGSFIVIWEFNGQLWSANRRYIEGELRTLVYTYDDEGDICNEEFIKTHLCLSEFCKNIRYIVLKS